MVPMFPEERLKKCTPPNCSDNFVMPAWCSGTTFRLSLFSLCASTLLEACEHIYSLCYAAYSPRPDSGESKRPADKDPSSWGVEEVVWFIKDADPQALGPHADAFRKHVGPPYIILEHSCRTKTDGSVFLACSWTSGREIPWKAEGVHLKLKICYETAVAIFIHLLIPCGPEYKSADMKAKWILLQHF